MSLSSLKEWLEDLKAKGRGEVRVAPSGARGRVYASSHDPKATLKIEVRRADGTLERLRPAFTVFGIPFGKVKLRKSGTWR